MELVELPQKPQHKQSTAYEPVHITIKASFENFIGIYVGSRWTFPPTNAT